MTVDRALDAVKVLIGIGALVALPVTGVTLGTTKQLLEGWKSGGALIKAVGKPRASVIEAEMIGCLNSHFEPFKGDKGMDDTALLVLQMIEKAEARPADIVQCKLDAARLTETLLLGFDGVADYRAPAVQTLFRVTVTDAYTRLFGNADFVGSVTPALWQEILQGQGRLEQMMLTMLEQQGELKVAIAQGVTQKRIMALARTIAATITDPEEAFRELEGAVAYAIEGRSREAMGSNAEPAVADLRRRLKVMIDDGRLSDAQIEAVESLRRFRETEADRVALARETESQVIDTVIERHLEMRDATAAASMIAEKISLENDPGERFTALRAEQDVWYERGRGRGLGFDLEVSIALAEESLSRAQGPDQRGAAGNDLGIALSTLGERQGDPTRLEAAVQAYEAALGERTRDRVPLDWAATQNNLGNALRILGAREGDPVRLVAAVRADEAALARYGNGDD